MSEGPVGGDYVNIVFWVVTSWSVVDIYYSLRLRILQGNVIQAI
jgi:hypothetical protein